MDLVDEILGKALRAKDVAKFLGINVRTVRKHYKKLGGIKLERHYIFFEKSLTQAILSGRTVCLDPTTPTKKLPREPGYIQTIRGKNYLKLKHYIYDHLTQADKFILNNLGDRTLDTYEVLEFATNLNTVIPLCALFYQTPGFEEKYAHDIVVATDGYSVAKYLPSPSIKLGDFFDLWPGANLRNRDGLARFCVQVFKDLWGTAEVEILWAFGIDSSA